MNAATETSESFAAPATAPRPVRPFYWSVKRELWENRSLVIAPAAAGGIVVLALLGLIVRAMTSHLPEMQTIPPELQANGAASVFGGIAWAISIAINIAVFFYLLDALQGERKDRSVLFWKSMPVSDTTTVLSKLFTALVVTGVIVVALAIATEFVVLVIASLTLLLAGANPGPFWSGQLLEMTVALIYWQITIALWYAPVAAWLLLVSAWAKRVTILWAVFTPFAIALFERIAIGTHYVQDVINARLHDPVLAKYLAHAKGAEFTVGDAGIRARGIPGRVFDAIDPVGFFSNPWLWVGLIVAAGFVAAAIWMRRYREPL